MKLTVNLPGRTSKKKIGKVRIAKKRMTPRSKGVKEVSPIPKKSRIENEDDSLGDLDNPGPSNTVLNNRGIPARKRKKNSLIFGIDDKISIPLKKPSVSVKKSSVSVKKLSVSVKPKRTEAESVPSSTGSTENLVKICPFVSICLFKGFLSV